MSASSRVDHQEARWRLRTIHGLVLLYLLALLPLTLHFLGRSPSEAFYRDAAAMMLDSGQWLWPRYYDGELRLLKPILPYWAVAVSYLTLGVSSFSSRLPFLLAGTGVVWLTYQLAWLLSARWGTAVLAAAIAASNAVLISASVRSIPDVMLCLFMTLSAYGLVGLMLDAPQRARFALAAYLGAALAVLSKGLLPLLLIAVVACYLTVRGDRAALRRLWHGPAIAAGAVVGASWFVAAGWTHGPLLMEQFWGDQAAEKVQFGPLDDVRRFIWYLLAWPAIFLPWSAFAVPAIGPAIRHWRQIDPAVRQVHLLTLAWCGALALLFALGSRETVRYLLPACPLVAVLLADILSRWGRRDWHRGAHRVTWAMMPAVIVPGVVLASLIGPTPWLALAALPVAMALLVPRQRWTRRLGLSHASAAGLCILALVPMGYAVMIPSLAPDEGTQIARTLRQLDLPDDEPVLLIGRRSLAERVRALAFHDAGPVVRDADLDADASPAAFRVVLVQDDALADYPELHGRDALPASRYPHRFRPPPHRLARLLPDSAHAKLDSLQRRYVLVLDPQLDVRRPAAEP